MKTVLIVMGICGFIGLLGIVGSMDFDDAMLEEAHYCEMRQLYERHIHTDNQRLGWPNFKPEIQCEQVKYQI